MKNPITFIKKSLVLFEKKNRDSMKNVEEQLKKLHEYKPKSNETKIDIENNPAPDYNEQKKKLSELEEQLNKCKK